MKTLTNRQNEIFDYICKYHKSHQYCPTLAEIASYFEFSSANAAKCHLEHLEKKGYITSIPKIARGIKINWQYSQQEDNTIPLLGKIAAGIPLFAEENRDDSIPMPPSFFGNGKMFALWVSGDSMVDAGILNGDVAIIVKQPDVESGDIAAVLIESEATLKRLIKKKDKLILRSENQAYQDIEIFSHDSIQVSVLGKYQGIIRSKESGWQR